MNIFFSKKNLIIFFFLLYFIFAYLVSWLLIDFYVKICTDFNVLNNVSKNKCFELEKKHYFPVIKALSSVNPSVSDPDKNEIFID